MIFLVLPLLLAQQPSGEKPAEPEAPGLNRDLFGVSIDRAGDLDGDGIEDLWVGDPSDAEGIGVEPYQCVWAVSGATGEALQRIAAPVGSMNFGSSVCALGDLDGDGVGDVAVGCCFVPTPDVPEWNWGIADTSPRGETAVFVYSGASGAAVFRVPGPADDWKVSGFVYAQGPAICAVGDWDGDGAADLAVGWAYADSEAIDCGRVAVVSGADGALLQSWYGSEAHDRLGAALCRLTDLDGDDRPELAASAIPDWVNDAGPDHPLLARERAGYVQILASNGATRNVLRPVDNARSFGLSLARFPDEDGDGTEDLLLGRPFSNGDSDVRIWSLKEGKLLRRLEDPYALSWATAGRQVPLSPDASTEFDRAQERVGYTFGTRLMAIPDRDGDGRADVLVTVADGGSPFATAFVGALSSRTGRPIALVPGLDRVMLRGEWQCMDDLGLALCALPDMDGDSVADFAIGGGCAVGDVCPGAVVICSGKEFVPIRYIIGAELRDGT